MIGTTIGIPSRGQSLTERLATPGMDVSTSPAEAKSKLQTTIQGTEKAVTPQADSTTERVAPPIAGGLQMEKTVLVTESAPIPETKATQKVQPR